MTDYLYEHFYDHTSKSLNGEKLWNAIQPHVERGDVSIHHGEGDREGLVLATYTRDYQYMHHSIDWEPLVKNCRGIIFDTTNNYTIVALPFPKFFNYGEGGIHLPPEGASIEAVYEKVDGSLGICFFWHDKWHITTRGSLNSDIGAEAQILLNEMLVHPPSEGDKQYTYMFEIILPDNRICVDYGSERKLVYLGARKISNAKCLYGNEWMLISTCLFDVIRQCKDAAKWYDIEYTVKGIGEFINRFKGNEFEGVVAIIGGIPYKFKGEDYKRLHWLMSTLTFNQVLAHYQKGELAEFRRSFDEELLPIFDKFVKLIDDRVDELVDRLVTFFSKSMPSGMSRKELALWLAAYHKGDARTKYIFKYLDYNFDAQQMRPHFLKDLSASDFDAEDKMKCID